MEGYRCETVNLQCCTELIQSPLDPFCSAVIIRVVIPSITCDSNSVYTTMIAMTEIHEY